MSLQARIEVERKIMRRVVLDALRAGYALNVDYGDGDALPTPASDQKEILKAMMQGDDDRLFYFKDGKLRRLGVAGLRKRRLGRAQ